MSAVSRPKVVHVRVAPVATKDNLFAQITVKIHSKQVRIYGHLELDTPIKPVMGGFVVNFQINFHP